jgi:hypothetical protein
MHVRQQIREAIKGILDGLNIDPLQGVVNVYANRRRVIPVDKYPAIRVQTPSETSRFETLDSIQRSPTVLIEVLLEDKDSYTVTPDDYAEAIEILMDDPAELAGLAADLTLQSTTLLTDSEHNIEQLTLAYSVEYFTAPSAPNVAL